jgi:hypothetical protein
MNREELRNILDDILLEETLYKKKDRVKEIKYLIYLKSEMIAMLKKDIKNLHKELRTLEKNKTFERKRQ